MAATKEKKETFYYDAYNLFAAPNRGMAKFTTALLDVIKASGRFEDVKGIAPEHYSVAENDNEYVFYGYLNPLLYEQISLVKYLKKHKPDYFLFPYNTCPVVKVKGVKYIVVVHDLIFLQSLSEMPLSKSLWQNLGRFYRRFTISFALRNADSIITVSEYTRRKIADTFKIQTSAITVIPNSVSHLKAAEGLDKQDTGRAFFLCVGGDSPNKNIDFLIHSYAGLPAGIKEKYILKIAGLKYASNIQRLEEMIASFNESDNIVLLPPVEEEVLTGLYRNCKMLIFPSLEEGFGIPLLEAMYYGSNIVCSNASAFPEICGDAAFYFDPTDKQSLQHAVIECIDNTVIAAEKKQYASDRVQLFSRQAFNKKVTGWLREL